MAMAPKTENPSLLVSVGVFTTSEVLSFISTETSTKAAMALICFDEDDINDRLGCLPVRQR